jgi:multidrug transporter EmrE-like cation transporter
VRTLGLVEVIFAQIVTRRLFKQGVSRREFAGMAMIIAGVVLLLNA